MNKLLHVLAKSQHYFIDFIRVAIFIVTLWIGGLKVANYEAEGIAPFVANSPFLSFFYNDPAHYKAHLNKEGQLVPANIEWHEKNGSYTFAYILGAAIVAFGLLTLLGIWFPKPGLVGGLMITLMALVTLSFLITTPETYVPDLGGAVHGFPYLSGAGRLVLKDLIMMAGALVCASQSAQAILGADARTIH